MFLWTLSVGMLMEFDMNMGMCVFHGFEMDTDTDVFVDFWA